MALLRGYRDQGSLIAIFVLLVGGLRDSRRLNAPAMLAEPYRRGDR